MFFIQSCLSENEGRTVSKEKEMNIFNDTLVIGGGCFWCTEAVFSELKGVVKVEAGYAGGNTIKPNYKEVCTGTTNHAEVIRIFFNNEIISMESLLDVFFATHDPTTLNKQGADIGTQYRSVIFYKNLEQQHIAIDKIRQLESNKAYSSKIITEVSPLKEFYIAEDYHQQYYSNNKEQAYCTFVISPKLEKLEKLFKEKLK